MRDFLREHKWVGIVGVVDVVVLIVLITLTVMKDQKNAFLDVALAPSSAKMIIDGVEYQNGTYKVYPGKVTATIKAEGFEMKTVELELKSDSATKVREYLLDEDGDLSWYETDADELDNLVKISNDGRVQELAKRMKIRGILPYYYAEANENGELVRFAVEADTVDCPERFCLQAVNIKNSTNEFIKEIMWEEGYDLDAYEVYYF